MPTGKEIAENTIIVFNLTGEITVCQGIQDYLSYLEELNDPDNRQ